MVREELNIFLSASIPMPERNKKYIGTADVIAIRDSVLALTTVALTNYHLIWGGHPSITALIAHVLRHSDREANKHVTLYQTKYFERFFPLENETVAHIEYTPDLGDKPTSLLEMRTKMIANHKYHAAFFIGGMEGVEDEFALFTKYHPETIVYPVASTGAAAKILFDASPGKYDTRLLTDLTYASLFKDLLNIK